MRTRDLKPGFFRNEELASLPAITRLLYQGLWCMADRRGRLKDSAALIKADVFPFENVPVEKHLALLCKAGFICRYESESLRLIWIPKFKANQHPHVKETESALPPHPEDTDQDTTFSGKSTGNAPEIPGMGSTEGEVEGSPGSPNLLPLTSNTLASSLSPPTTDPVGDVAAAFAKFGKVTSGTAQSIEEDVKEFSLEWVQRAVREAAKAGFDDRPPWSYVNAMLERWLKQGGPDDGRTQTTKRASGRGSGGGSSGDILAGWRAEAARTG